MDLSPSEIHVWPVALETSPEEWPRLCSLLSADETIRANKFRFDRHRRAFVLARASLRLLLSKYLAEPPEHIEFVYAEKGKPRLAANSNLRFNLGHSGESAIFAFTRDCELGVDIEIIRPMDDLLGIASRFFHADECRDLFDLPFTERVRAFFLLWTRKEAQIKATGEGLTSPLDQLAGDGWIIQNLEIDPLVAAAIAYRQQPHKVLKLLSARSADTLWA